MPRCASAPQRVADNHWRSDLDLPRHLRAGERHRFVVTSAVGRREQMQPSTYCRRTAASVRSSSRSLLELHRSLGRCGGSTGCPTPWCATSSRRSTCAISIPTAGSRHRSRIWCRASATVWPGAGPKQHVAGCTALSGHFIFSTRSPCIARTFGVPAGEAALPQATGSVRPELPSRAFTARADPVSGCSFEPGRWRPRWKAPEPLLSSPGAHYYRCVRCRPGGLEVAH
jgi:hypothetical protein